MNNIIVTGGSGFIGSRLIKHQNFSDSTFVGRSKPKGCKNFIKFDFENDENYKTLFNNTKFVIHLAGKAHIFKKKSQETIDNYLKLNFQATKKLARAAANASVKRFIFISTIKVLGDHTENGKKYKYNDPYKPQDIYSLSKTKAEKELLLISSLTKMEIVIIRTPLVYGSDSKGNLKRLINLIKLNIPLPFICFKNKRSYLSINNLIELINVCLYNQNAKNKIFNVCDDQDMSLSDLMYKISQSMGKNSKLFYLPKSFLYIFFLILGKKDVFDKFDKSLQVDNNFCCETLNWSPKHKFEDEFFSE